MTTFYITTPIYYVNDKPHIGHAYTTILADVLARYHRLLGDDTWFLTGTDEHGQKVANAAAANGISPLEQANQTVVRFQELWVKLGITNDDFLRTTEERHKRVVRGLLQRLYDQGEICRGSYEGWYSVFEERFFTEKDLVDGCDPIGHRPVEKITETAYYFRMSKYQEWLIGYIQAHPEFIQPEFRRNEVLGFLRQPLGDLCISRPKARLAWGIELPFDQDYVTYVWFDALTNYISAIGYPDDSARFQRYWPVNYHLIGKDILTTHSVYWPTMLKAADVPLPRTIFAHGWWMVGRDKMGKSLGNVVDPMAVCDRYGVDAFRYFVMAEMTPGNDASFTEPGFIERYNNDLADGVGNMLSRVVKLIVREFDSRVPAPGPLTDVERDLQATTLAAVDQMATAIGDVKIDRGLAAVIAAVGACNRYFEQTKPWVLKKEGNRERLGTVLYTAAEALRILAGLLHPVIPQKMGQLRAAFGLGELAHRPVLAKLRTWGVLAPGTPVADPGALFPRVDAAAVAATASLPAAAAPGGDDAKSQAGKSQITEHPAAPAAVAPALAGGAGLCPAPGAPIPAAPAGVVTQIDLGQFQQVQLRTAKVLVAEPVTGADRLLRLEIEVGSEKRQIVAGIAKFYAPAALVGRTIVIVANLKPAMLCGLESNGMLLAAKAGKKHLVLVTVDGECPSGVLIG